MRDVSRRRQFVVPAFTSLHADQYTTRFPGNLGKGRVAMVAAEKLKEVTERVKQIIGEQLGVDESEVTPSASFVDDLGADSLDQVELVMALEEVFDLEISDEDAEKIRTVQEAIDHVAKHARIRVSK